MFERNSYSERGERHRDFILSRIVGCRLELERVIWSCRAWDSKEPMHVPYFECHKVLFCARSWGSSV